MRSKQIFVFALAWGALVGGWAVWFLVDHTLGYAVLGLALLLFLVGTLLGKDRDIGRFFDNLPW